MQESKYKKNEDEDLEAAAMLLRRLESHDAQHKEATQTFTSDFQVSCLHKTGLQFTCSC